MSVRIVDGCGGVTQTWTDDEGHIDRWGQTFCPNDPASIVISSYHEPAPLTISVFQHAQQPPVFATLGALRAFLTDDPNDYTVPHEAVVGFVPALDALGPAGFDFNAAVTDDTVATSISIAEWSRRSLDYYDGWTDLSNEVHLNVLWDDSEVVQSGNYNFYEAGVHPGLIHIHPSSGWSKFALAHETGHLFHYFYLRNHGPGVNNPPYGRFGEPMSHIHAAAIIRSGWMAVYEGNSKAETLDYNGKYEENLGGAKQAEMEFYADPLAAAATLQCGGINEDECCDEPNAVAQGNCVMGHAQGWDWRIYYDLLDGPGWLNPEPVDEFIAGGNTIPAGDFDDFDGNLGFSWAGDAINDVLIHYLGRGGNANPDYVDRGRTMVDLVDVLDGLSCRGHVTQADMEELLEDAMGYDYDFAYVGSACP